jgi:hypothetical protein
VVVIGLILLVAALAAAAVLIVSNQDTTMPMHALGHTWHWHQGWILVAWLSITLTGLLGVALIRAGLTYARRLRRETAKLLAERAAFNHHLPDPDRSPFFAGKTHPEAAAAPVTNPRKRHWFRRGHHAV